MRITRPAAPLADSTSILQAMVRFGMELLPPPRASPKVRPETTAYGAVESWYDGPAAADIDEVYRLVVAAAEFTLASARGADRDTAATRASDLVLTAPARVLVAARRGETTLADALATGAATASGSKRALRNFQRIYRLP